MPQTGHADVDLACALKGLKPHRYHLEFDTGMVLVAYQPPLSDSILHEQLATASSNPGEVQTQSENHKNIGS